jgi:hypothetical protein
LVAAVWFAASFWSASARADGGIPRAYNILFEPGNPSHIVVRSQYWGLFDGHTGSSSWSLLCSQAYGGRALDPDNYATVLAKGGRLLVAGQFSGLNISDDTCNWKQSDAFNMEAVQGIAPMDALGTNFAAVTVLGTADGVTSRVYTSTDRGDTWTPVKGTIPMDVSMANLAVAPSDPKRVYVVGVTINGGPRQIAVSKDGGASFTTRQLGLLNLYDSTLIKPLSVAGILPSDPDTLFVRADGGDMQGAMADDELWMSRDGGTSWSLVLTATGDLPGFALAPDGKSVLVSGPQMGILRASLVDVYGGQGRGAFTQIYVGQVWGLAYQGNQLYAGNDDYSMKPSFTVGVSSDGGKTFRAVMTKCDVEFPSTCPSSSTMQMLCLEQWTRQGGYETDYLQNACMQNLPPPTGTGGNGAIIGTGGSTGAVGSGGAGAVGGSSSTGGQVERGDAGPGDAGGIFNRTIDNGAGLVGQHVGLKSLKCSVGVPRGSHTRLATLVAAAAVAGLGGMRGRRRATSSR